MIAVRQKLSELRGAIEDARRDATPPAERVLRAIGSAPISWDAVAETLGVSPVDSEACAMRGFLLADREIAWCDSDGDPIPPSNGGIVIRNRYLRRVTSPQLSPTQQARLEAAMKPAS